MNKETLRMQMLAGLITEGQYKQKLNESEEIQMLDGYEVDFFKTKSNTYANIEIPSENPAFEDDIQIKGTGQTEEEAFEDLKLNYEKYKKGFYMK